MSSIIDVLKRKLGFEKKVEDSTLPCPCCNEQPETSYEIDEDRDVRLRIECKKCRNKVSTWAFTSSSMLPYRTIKSSLRSLVWEWNSEVKKRIKLKQAVVGLDQMLESLKVKKR